MRMAGQHQDAGPRQIGEDSDDPASCMTGRIAALQQVTKPLNAEASVPDDAAERERVDRVISRDRQDANPIRHDDVLALTGNGKSGFLKGAHHGKVVDARNFRQDQAVTSISRISSPRS